MSKMLEVISSPASTAAGLVEVASSCGQQYSMQTMQQPGWWARQCLRVNG
jgi:hypothetical protein